MTIRIVRTEREHRVHITTNGGFGLWRIVTDANTARMTEAVFSYVRSAVARGIEGVDSVGITSRRFHLSQRTAAGQLLCRFCIGEILPYRREQFTDVWVTFQVKTDAEDGDISEGGIVLRCR